MIGTSFVSTFLVALWAAGGGLLGLLIVAGLVAGTTAITRRRGRP